MAFFDWVPDYSVDLLVIDNQHKKLVDLTNQIYKLRKSKLSPLECLKIIRSAISYVDEHFSTEEDIMEARKFELIESHKKEHANFITTTLKIINEFEKTGNIDLDNLATFLKTWIIKHIATIDKQHFKIMIKHGLTNEIANDFGRELPALFKITEKK
jgi:hemerythrin